MKGTWETRVFKSKALEGNPLGDPSERVLGVYLPPGYAKAGRDFPAVYFLHGFHSSAASWSHFSGFTPTVPERLDQLIVSGTIPPVIGVFPDGWTSFGGSQWINSEAIGNYQDYLALDVIHEVDSSYRTIARPEARAVAGKSSGGYGALALVQTYPEVFSHIACHSGDAYFEYCYLPDFPKAAGAFLKSGGVEAWFLEFVRRSRETKARSDDFPAVNILAMAAAYSPKKGEPLGIEFPFEFSTGRLRPKVWERWLERDPVRFVPKYLDGFRKLRSLFIDCGTRDEWNLPWGARMLAEQWTQAKVDHVYEEFEDSHSGINYRFDRSLAYIAPRFG